MNYLDQLARMLRPLHVRLANLVARAVVELVRDAEGMQELQVSVLDGETRDGLERLQEYGFTSVPLPGAEAAVLFVGGRRDHGLVVAVDDRRHRPTGLLPGEVCLYHKDGARVLFKADGSVEIAAAAGQSIKLNGGAKGVALADHSHPFTLTAPNGGGPVTGTIGASNSNAAGVKA
jgi:phage baseplate assembly protein V